MISNLNRVRTISAGVLLIGLAIWLAQTLPSSAGSPTTSQEGYSVLNGPADGVAAGSRLLSAMSTGRPELGLRPAEAHTLPTSSSASVGPQTTIAVIPGAKTPCLYSRSGAGV